ncbi:MAG: EAL domain-containing protein [Eubacterium sp.]|nr:EAL domain-containing protein [Eubacterium sp.]
MANRGKIAVLVGQADEEYQRRFIEGFLTQTCKADLDVCVFSMYRKYQSTVDRELGEANIFHLVNYDLFEGVVMLKDTIQTTGAAERIEDEIHEKFDGPVLVIEQPSEYFDSVFADSYSPIVEIVSHLIEEHHYRDIAFLTGKKWHPHSKQRLEAYKEAMREHGLEIRPDRIIYGDFWYRSGELCVDQLLSGDAGLPEAIACANDQMAIGVCEALTERGYRIPDDVAVVGFDSIEEGRTSPVPLTSAMIPARQCGIYAADYILAKMEGREVGEFTDKAEVLTGPSCGCYDGILQPIPTIRESWGTDLSTDGYYSINNFMADDLMSQINLMGFLSTVYTYAYQLGDVKDFHLCLQETWGAIDHEEGLHFKNDGYDRHMIHAVCYHGDGADGKVDIGETFESSILLPELGEDEEPGAYFFTPVFYEDECFGYSVIRYRDQTRSYDSIYRQWIEQVSRSIESLRRAAAMHISEMKSAEAKKFSRVRAVDQLQGEEKADCETVESILDENLFTYHFQPIVRVSDGEIYSYEALMRSNTERRVSPLGIIKYSSMLGRLGDVEKATFLNVLRLVETNKDAFQGRKVFVNSIPGVKLDQETYDEMDALLTKHHDDIVVEFTEEAELIDEELDRLKAYFRDRGIETAVDDYGTGYSNVANLLRYMPDYVKIDRSLLSEIQDRPQKQYFVREIIDFCHDNDIKALAEGVETTEELRMVIHLGADLIQGYYTAKPAPEVVTEIGEGIKNEIMSYAKERRDGLLRRSYKAGRTVRVPLNTLIKEGYSEIVVGEDNPVCRDVTFTGAPGMATDLHMRIMPNYTGVLTLENVYFSNLKGRPCIDLSEGDDVTLIFRGENVMRRGGIRVPEGAKLTIEGGGDLLIRLDTEEFYGIGNDIHSGNGTIIFHQDGEIHIDTTGKDGVCIGSGHGGKIRIERGKYLLDASSDMCVGIGAKYGDVDMKISECAISTEFSLFGGVCIGSMEGSVRVSIAKSSVKTIIGGTAITGIGTVEGESTEIHVESAGLVANSRGDRSTCFGSLQGSTVMETSYTGIRAEAQGKDALILGGLMGEASMKMSNSDMLVKIKTEVPVDKVTRKENLSLTEARCQYTINDEAVDIRER